MSARDEILHRVRSAVRGAPAPAPVVRDYRLTSDDDLDVFVERLHHYDATVLRAAPSGVAATIRDRMAVRGARRIVVPAGLPPEWVDQLGVDTVRDDPPLSYADLDAVDGVITGCTVAIAATGTLVLTGGAPGMGRRALSLVPDYHLCVVRADQIVPSVPQALATLDPAHALTFVSGPSATVDIEMVRVAGVHGPRTLDVLIAA